MIRELAAAGSRQLVLNLKDVAYFSSSAVEPLVAAAREVARLGGEIKIAGIHLSSDDVLTIARLYAVFDIVEDDATAVCNFALPSSRHSEMFRR
jgi:anti-anti-sigma factor